MDKEQILNEIIQKLNVVNKGVFKSEDYSDEKISDLNDIKELLDSRQQISTSEQSAIIEELSKMRK